MSPGAIPHPGHPSAGEVGEDSEAVLSSGQVRSRAAAGVVFVALHTFAMRGLGLLGSLVLARLLVPEDFGVLAFGAASIV